MISPASNAWIDDLVSRQQPGWTLEREFYCDPEIFELDLERVFCKRWLFAGAACRIPRHGDFFVYDVAGESLIVIRDEQGEIQCLYNTCRHRGSRVCLSDAGHARKLVCPYHAWTYETDGSLAAARH